MGLRESHPWDGESGRRREDGGYCRLWVGVHVGRGGSTWEVMVEGGGRGRGVEPVRVRGDEAEAWEPSGPGPDLRGRLAL